MLPKAEQFTRAELLSKTNNFPKLNTNSSPSLRKGGVSKLSITMPI